MTVLEDASPSPAVEAPASRLDPRVVTVWRLSAGLVSLLLVAAAGAALLALGWSLVWLIPFLAFAFYETVALPAKRYRGWSYRVGEDDLRLTRGVLWRNASVVLHSRIQHVDTRQGPLERAFGLATVVVYTAGTVGAMVAIPGVEAAEAERLRDRLAALSGREDVV